VNRREEFLKRKMSDFDPIIPSGYVEKPGEQVKE